MPERSRLAPLVLVLAAALVARAAWFAWVSDDAYLTLRTLDNMARGHGPCWNVGERVQVYTHPLWMFLLAAATTASREHYVTSMVLGLVLSSLAAVVLGLRVARTTASAALALWALLVSRAFADYATSGLENPLAHVLLGLFFVAWFSDSPRRRGAALAFAGLAACNRLDASLLLLPAVVDLARQGPARATAKALGLAALPLVAWEAFALVYYGTPIPNPAHAKLGTGIPAVTLALQGTHYLWNSLRLDPTTLGVTAVAATLALARRPPRSLPIVIGIGLHLLYVVWIGGDFMSGRFLTTSLFAAAALLARLDWRPRPALALAAGCGVATAIAFGAAARGTPASGAGAFLAAIDAHGIADERRFYAPVSAWRGQRHDLAWPDPGSARAANAARVRWPEDPIRERLRAVGLVAATDSLPADVVAAVQQGRARPVIVGAAVGTFGYYAGPGVHVLDLYALGDPLRARLPAERSDPLLPQFLRSATADAWRPGHFVRRIPAGYIATLASGENRLAEPHAAALWEDVARATRGPLFAPGRFGAIARLTLRRPASGHAATENVP